MTTSILVFASLREAIGQGQISAALTLPCEVKMLKNQLADQYPVIKTAIQNDALLVAVNQQMAADEVVINDGDEIALFPPVTGG
ncbi:molybdopterin synthase sulfur carrier subunit [Neiella marina]|uniref:Molybdopterin synthase sulfur carrier subunit n=1 Tax=Neiella marina TaxID=508461 RepID=A0A8J2U3B9_9GAMM|nr:MoaD/ThiS family protein [Neiella marina]GGA70576.1 molybdopterin synthase sulfur carrier subunit [Neiella marina]